MAIWVVVLEAAARDDPQTIEPDDLDALAEALADTYPRVAGGPSFFQAEFWVEEATAGAAVMLAQRLWQAAVRDIGMPPWDVVRAEARDAHAIEAGLVEWTPEADDEDEELPENPYDVVEDEHRAGVDDYLADEELEPEQELEPVEDLEEEPEEEPPPPPRKRAAAKKAGRKRPAARR